MSGRYEYSFQPIDSTAPGFNSTLGSSGTYALESTGAREWQFPTSRSIALASIATAPYYVTLGGSGVGSNSTDGQLFLGGVHHTMHVDAGISHIAFASSTDVTVNVALGYGGH